MLKVQLLITPFYLLGAMLKIGQKQHYLKSFQKEKLQVTTRRFPMQPAYKMETL
jgi:hypothetical protein